MDPEFWQGIAVTRLLMHLVRMWPYCLLALAPIVPAPAAALNLAVSYFDNQTGDPNWQPLSKGLADMLITDLAATEGLVVVERARLQAVMDELALAKSPFVDPATAQRLGAVLGASQLLVGSFAVQGAKLRIDARAIDVASGAVKVAAAQIGPSDDVFAVEAGLADKLRASLALKKPGSAAAPPRLTADDVRSYGRGLDALDQGQIDDARRILATLASKRPDFAQVQRGLAQLASRIRQLLARSKLAPERVLALAAQIEAGQTDVCLQLFHELSQMQMAAVKTAEVASPGSDPASRNDPALALARFYAVTLALLDRPALSKPVCLGNQSAAGATLAMFLFTIAASAKQVVDCHPLSLEQNWDPQSEVDNCERILRRIHAIKDAHGQVLVAVGEYPELVAQLGQTFVDRYAADPFAVQLLPMIQGFVEFLQLTSLSGPAQQQAIVRAVVAKARRALAAEAEAGMMLAMVQLPADPKVVERILPATALLRLRHMGEELAKGTARIELSTDAGTSWGHTWPLASESPGYTSVTGHQGPQPTTKLLVGDGGWPRGKGVFVVDAMRRWYRDAAWLGPAWSEASLGDLRVRLVAVDDSELGRCTVRPDPVATRAAKDDSRYGRVVCHGP